MKPMPYRRLRWPRLVLVALTGFAACGGGSASEPGAGAGGPGNSAGAGNLGGGASGGKGGAGMAAAGALSGGIGGGVGTGGAGNAGQDAGGTAGQSSHQNPATGSGPELSSYLFGQNYWSEPDIEALWPIVKASGVKLVRFGGAGPDDEQPSNERYGSVVAQIRAIGAEPYLQISRHFDATRAKQIVDYINNQQHLHVLLWSINNEPDIGANESLMSVADSATLVKTLASAMKEADPTIQIFAPELAYYNEQYLGPLLGGSSDITGKDGNGRYYIDGVSFHTYPFGADYTRDKALQAPAGFRSSVGKLLTALSTANKKNGRSGASALKWALTEFNLTYQNPADNSVDGSGVQSFLNGQFFAELFGIGMANNAVTLATWSVHESNGNRGSTDLGFLDGPVAGVKPRSSYYHLQLLAQNFAGHSAPATSTQPLLRVVAAGDGSHVSVLLLNESIDQTYAYGVRLDNGKLAQHQSVTVSVDAALAAELAGSIAAQSTQLLVFDNAGNLSKRVDYAISDARSATPPRAAAP